MIRVTIKPYLPIDQAIEQIRTHYPDAFHDETRLCEPGRYSCVLPSKNASNWTEGDDANFFNNLSKDGTLISWAILGGSRGRDFTGQH